MSLPVVIVYAQLLQFFQEVENCKSNLKREKEELMSSVAWNCQCEKCKRNCGIKRWWVDIVNYYVWGLTLLLFAFSFPIFVGASDACQGEETAGR